MTKGLILDAIKKKTPFSFLVHRPKTEYARNQVDLLLYAAQKKLVNQDGEWRPNRLHHAHTAELLPSDALAICRLEVRRRRDEKAKGGSPKVKSIVVPPSSNNRSPVVVPSYGWTALSELSFMNETVMYHSSSGRRQAALALPDDAAIEIAERHDGQEERVVQQARQGDADHDDWRSNDQTASYGQTICLTED